MPKCNSCSKGLCEGNYDYSYRCDNIGYCSCTCQESSEDTFVKGFLSVAYGVAAFAGGVALTVSTGGLGAVGIAAAIGGGALTGAGATAAMAPITKKVSGERMTGKEYVKDLVVGGTVGAVTGPIGLGGANVASSITSQVGQKGVVMASCRAATGAVSGTAAGIIQEAASGEFSVKNVLKSAAVGAVTGTASHVTSSLTSNMSPGLTCSATKVVADTASTAAIDSVTLKITEGKVDPKKLALSIGARAATSAGYEAVAGATYAAHGGKKELRKKLGTERTKVKNELDKRFQERSQTENQQRQVNDDIRRVKNDPSITPEDRRNELHRLQTMKDGLKKDWRKHTGVITKCQNNMPKLPELKAVAPRKPQCKISKKPKSDDEHDE